MNVITRFPPSPTGYLHIGSARTALFNYLFAAHHGGTMYLRFEDTDKERSKKEFEKDIIDGLAWLEIPYTSALPSRQSERLDAYQGYLRALIEKGAAYEAEENEKGEKVIRFRNPQIRLTFSDLIRGSITFDTTELKDFVIARSINAPLYHLAVVADDHDAGVTHIIRGEDHISNTPRQILILEALGFQRPLYAHIPLILALDRSKLSKRNAATSVNEYRQEYLSAAVLNYLALLGWTPPSGREKMSLGQLVAQFRLEDVHKSAAIFDLKKLQWLNHLYVLEMADEEYRKAMVEYVPTEWKQGDNERVLEKIIPLLKERTTTWRLLQGSIAEGEFGYFFRTPAYDIEKIPEKKSDAPTTKRHLTHLRKLLAELPSSHDVTREHVKGLVWDYAEAEGRGSVLWPLRYALTGRERSPDPFTVGAVIGKEKVLDRIDAAIKALEHP